MPEMQAVLEDVVTLLAIHCPRPLTRTSLVKLLYFVDLRSWERRGHPLTDLHWIWHHYGPYTREITPVVAELESNDELTVEEALNTHGSVIYRIQPGPRIGLYGVLSEDDRVIVDDVVNEFGAATPSLLTELSYQTEPIERAQARGDSLDFSIYTAAEEQVRPFVPDRTRPRSS